MSEPSESPRRKAVRSGSEKPSKPSPESPEPFDCQLPLGHSTQGLQMKGYRGEVTMDPITHYSELVLSSGWRNVHLGDESRNVPIYRERVNTDVCVLASERSDSKKPLKAHPELPEPRDCRLPLLHGSQRIQKKDGRVEMTLDPRRAKPELILSRRTEMTLDLKTAYPELVFSRDRRSVRLGDERHKVPNYYERFDTDPCVLASEGFSFGRYSWEVEVGDAGCWAVGVARKSVKRKGPLRLTPEHGFWTVERHMGKYWALSSSPFRVFCEERLLRIGICLDYVAGQVHFHNPETLAHLYTFTTTFMEEIFPFFYTEDKQTPLVITKFETE
ncbi:tripartite motif-containing 39 [Chelydra serpentina]|uniref:Tripartite motif-containing 39 n=1 Tax=Chelydra serpentina TaxID=8475 RepID=A0A8T1S5T7_CHESE|nr:tripartite motif-containing 39 [Chelydra serpentina]